MQNLGKQIGKRGDDIMILKKLELLNLKKDIIEWTRIMMLDSGGSMAERCALLQR